MKETKISTGYLGKNPRDSHNGNRHNGSKRSHSILPPPHILQEYERLSEGATDRLIELAEIEQSHRHDWEDACLRGYIKSHRIGQLFGVIIAIAILISASYLAINGDRQSAAIISISGFISLVINSIVTATTRRFDRKPRKYTQKHDRDITTKTEAII